MDPLVHDLLEEDRALDRLVASLDDAAWSQVTPFFDWTVRDQILHLYQIDRLGLISLADADAFARTVADIRVAQARGIELSGQIRQEFADVPNPVVLTTWRDGYARVAQALRDAAPGRRVTWFGPDMATKSFASARLMEVWAHGQDIYDMLGLQREATGRIKHICELGVRTFAWSFRNRGLDVPTAPVVKLVGPGGEQWNWGSDGNGSVSGPALDFALVVTQRRAWTDTALRCDGAAACAWLDIAQCFAGAPQEAAAPGSRPAI